MIAVVSDVVDIFNGTSGEWTSARLSVARYGLAATSLSTQGLAFFAGGFEGPNVAYYEVTTGQSIVVGTHNIKLIYVLTSITCTNLCFFVGAVVPDLLPLSC